MTQTLRPYPQYRPSGISWLGDIPANWEVKRLKQVLSRNDGGVWGEDPKISPDGNEIGTLVLRSTEQTAAGDWIMENPAYRSLTFDEAFNFRLIAGDLVITKSSGSELHIGKTSLVTKEIEDLGCCYSNFMQRLRVTKKSNPRFVRYIINGNIGRAQFVYLSKSTSGLANLNSEIIDNVYIPLPPPEEQQAIAAYLDRETHKLDELISRKERFILLLAEKRSALISHAVTRGLNPDAPTKQSGVEWLGEIPAHWEIISLRRLSHYVQTGKTPPTEERRYYDAEEIYWYRPSDFTENLFLAEAEKLISRSAVDENKAPLVASNTLLIVGIGASIGKSAVTPYQSSFNQQLTAIRFNQKINIVFGGYLFRWLEPVIREISSSSTLAILNQDGFKSLILPVPPIEEQKKISAFLDRETSKIDRMTEKTRQHIARLQERRSALISAAVTGKIDVRSFEKRSGERKE